MFRKMRRSRQLLDDNSCIEILNRCTSGVLAVQGDNDYPYAVPLSYAYASGKLYFHCAVEGHKIDAIMRNDKCSFCVIDKDEILPEKFTTLFRSVICFGKIKLIDDIDKKEEALNLLSGKYSADIESSLRSNEIASSINRVMILELDIEHMTGKQAIELAK